MTNRWTAEIPTSEKLLSRAFDEAKKLGEHLDMADKMPLETEQVLHQKFFSDILHLCDEYEETLSGLHPEYAHKAENIGALAPLAVFIGFIPILMAGFMSEAEDMKAGKLRAVGLLLLANALSQSNDKFKEMSPMAQLMAHLPDDLEY